MARLIDADALIEAMDLQNCTKYGNESAEQQYHSYSSMMLYEIKDMIDDEPTVDAVEVVRCQDCKRKTYERNGIRCNIFGCFMHRHDFCSHGRWRE